MTKWLLLFFTVIFGAVTLFMSSSVIFDWFGIRAKEGNFVPAIVWANWLCGILYLIAGYGIFKMRTWAKKPISIALLSLIVGSLYLFVHISIGGLYETKTVGAMAFRVVVTLLLLLTTIKIFKK